MFYALLDEFGQTLGEPHASMDAAESALRQLGEAAGEAGIIELTELVPDMSDVKAYGSLLTGRRWRFDFLTETLVPEAAG